MFTVVSEYQEEMRSKLIRLFSNNIPVETEWRTIQNINGIYCPRIDIAVGPFSITRGNNQINSYNKLLNQKRDFIDKIIEFHNVNTSRYRTNDEQINRNEPTRTFENLHHFNENARCFLAIEIENNVSRKHLLGGAVNASVLGRIGICIGWTPEKVKALIKVQAYWDFLRSVGKNTFETKNLIILDKNQFRESIYDSI